jgi:hypothetical protein
MLTVLSPNRTVVDFPPRKIDLIVIHDMEWTETDQTAEACAAYFAKPTTKASAHKCFDNNSVVRCVPDKDVAWCAPGANHNGLQYELAGYARQTLAEWADPYTLAMLRLVAQQAALDCKRYSIPNRFVTWQELRQGVRGITTHAQATLAFPGPGRSHTDPGPNFPMGFLLAQIGRELEKLNPPKMEALYQIVNNGKVVMESVPSENMSVAAQRVRLDSFLGNHIRAIHAALAADPDGAVQIKLVKREVPSV